MQHAQHALQLRIGLGIAKGDLHGYKQRTLCIGKADHETIMYIGRHRRLQVYAYSFPLE